MDKQGVSLDGLSGWTEAVVFEQAQLYRRSCVTLHSVSTGRNHQPAWRVGVARRCHVHEQRLSVGSRGRELKTLYCRSRLGSCIKELPSGGLVVV